jgi:hypothetical protein
MTNAGKTTLATIRANAILEHEMSALNLDPDSIAK